MQMRNSCSVNIITSQHSCFRQLGARCRAFAGTHGAGRGDESGRILSPRRGPPRRPSDSERYRDGGDDRREGSPRDGRSTWRDPPRRPRQESRGRFGGAGRYAPGPPARRPNIDAEDDDNDEDDGDDGAAGVRDAAPKRPAVGASRARGSSAASGRGGAPGPARARPAEGGAEPQDPFDQMHSHLTRQLAEGVVIRKESWDKLLGRLRTRRQADAALALMREDARAREAGGWDWATHGYGQTAYQLVQAAAQAGAPGVAEQLLELREELHLKLNKDLVPTLMRKVAAAAADVAADGDDVGEHVDVVQRLYDQEVVLRGANSPDAAYELSRVLRRAEDVGGVRSLHAQMEREDLAIRDRLLEDIENWLAKRGVRV